MTILFHLYETNSDIKNVCVNVYENIKKYTFRRVANGYSAKKIEIMWIIEVTYKGKFSILINGVCSFAVVSMNFFVYNKLNLNFIINILLYYIIWSIIQIIKICSKLLAHKFNNTIYLNYRWNNKFYNQYVSLFSLYYTNFWTSDKLIIGKINVGRLRQSSYCSMC